MFFFFFRIILTFLFLSFDGKEVSPKVFQGQENPGYSSVTIVKPVSVAEPTSPRVFTSLPSSFSPRKATHLGKVVGPGHRSTALAFRGHSATLMVFCFVFLR